MLVIGKTIKFQIIDKKDVSLIDFSSLIIFGKNGAGKTSLFDAINKKIYYEYSEFRKNVALFSKYDPIFVNELGKISKIHREKVLEEFETNIINVYSKVSFSVYKKWLKKALNKKPKTDKLLTKIANRSDIPKSKFKLEKNYKLIFKYFPLQKEKVHKALKIFLKIIKKMSSKEKENALNTLMILSVPIFFKDVFKTNKEKEAYYSFLKIIQFIDFINIHRIYLEASEKIETFLNIIDSLYGYEMEYNIFSLDIPQNNKNINFKYKETKIINLINKNFKNGKSYSIKKFNRILGIIKLNIYKTNMFVFDDPFDGMDDKTILDLSSLFCELIKNNFRFLVLTNNLSALRYLKHYDSKKKISMALIEKDNLKNGFNVEEVTNNANLIFKYHDSKYYDNLEDFFKDFTTSLFIKNLLFSYHRQTIWESKKILSFIGKTSNEDNLEIIYDDMTKITKLQSNKNVLKYKEKDANKWINKIISNRNRLEILRLATYGQKAEFFIEPKYGEIMMIKMIAMLALQSLYDQYLKILEKLIKVKINKENDEYVELLKKKIELFKSNRDLLAHPKEHMIIWAYLIVENENKWIELFILIEDLWTKHMDKEFSLEIKNKIKKSIDF